MAAAVMDEMLTGANTAKGKMPARVAERRANALDPEGEGQVTNVLKAERLSGKYLAFLLGPEEFAIQVLKVREIMGIQDITAVPQTPSYVKGVINLRGKVVP